jgi:hypothetical protein
VEHQEVLDPREHQEVLGQVEHPGSSEVQDRQELAEY